jgi:hypothetical protein
MGGLPIGFGPTDRGEKIDMVQAKGPAVSDGPLEIVFKINWGTNELSFADRGDVVNISGDRLAFVQTNA